MADRYFRYVRYIAPNAVNAAMQATATHGSARRDLSLRVWLEPARATAPALHSSSESLPHVLSLQELHGSFALHRHGLRQKTSTTDTVRDGWAVGVEGATALEVVAVMHELGRVPSEARLDAQR